MFDIFVLTIFVSLIIAVISETYWGWRKYIPLIYKMRPTRYKTEKVYSTAPENILNVDFSDMDEIHVYIDVKNKSIYFRRKYLMFNPQIWIRVHSSWPLWGTIKLSDLGGKTKADIVGKLPFTTSYFAFLLIMPISLAGMFISKGKLEFSLAFVFIPLVLIPIGQLLIYGMEKLVFILFEKKRFIRHINDIDELLMKNGIHPELQ